MAARSRALLLASDGDLAGARASVEAALTAQASVPQPLELARTLILHGALERRAKRRGASRAALERALALLVALPAPLWAARAEAELERLGVRSSGQRLSTTEARIAGLVTEGLTNTEIAAAMFVSRKTVEANLTKVYRKLGVRSRTELTRHHFTRTGISPIE
jgi:DNA-binding NarL/FixJ family response regulator